MKRNVKRVLFLVFGLIFVVSLGMVIYQWAQYREGTETYQEAEELAGIPDFSEEEPVLPEQSAEAAGSETGVTVDPYAEKLQQMDFAALREVNPEIRGWIVIPSTVISYPLLQGSDNSYYLKHTWKKTVSSVGSIFLEQWNRADLTDFNTVIYGHNMNNGSMFGTLKKYKNLSYFKSHPYVYVKTDSGSICYEIFAAYEVSTVGTTYQLSFPDDAARQAFLDFCVEQSVIDTGVTPHTYDRILTLSTCTGRGHSTRWVVQARLPGTAPAPVPAENEELPAETEIPPEESEQVVEETTVEETGVEEAVERTEPAE